MTSQAPDQVKAPAVRILIVDDRPANLDALEAILAETGFRITRANSGNEALKRLLKRQYACCLLDVRMPGMNGFETAQLIRQDVELRHMPIIFVTAEASDQKEVFKGYEAGAIDFLIKPLEPAIVRSKVQVLGELYQQKLKLARTEAIEALNERLKQANESLNTANQDLEHYTHIAAHDLREPLRKQRNIIGLLKAEFPEEGTASELMDYVEQSADQMLGMIDDFRALTKIDYADLTRQTVDMRALIDACLHSAAGQIEAQAPTVIIPPALGEERVYERLARVLYVNLIKNVFHHVSEPRFTLEFTLEDEGDGAPIVYGVRNTGSTIPERHLAEVFKMFRKGRSSRAENSGVGLSICKRIIDRHNGRIFAESGDDHVHIKFTFWSAK